VKEYDSQLPLASCGGYEVEMRYRVAARAQGLVGDALKRKQGG
jgi:hypothetical protein